MKILGWSLFLGWLLGTAVAFSRTLLPALAGRTIVSNSEPIPPFGYPAFWYRLTAFLVMLVALTVFCGWAYTTNRKRSA